MIDHRVTSIAAMLSAPSMGLALPRTLSRTREGEGAWDAFPIFWHRARSHAT